MKPAERRYACRCQIHVPMLIHIFKSSGHEELAESVNLSELGVYFVTQSPLKSGTAIQIVLEMPEEVTGESNKNWRCMGHVVHTEPVTSVPGGLGVGVRFDYYEILGMIGIFPELSLSLPLT